MGFIVIFRPLFVLWEGLQKFVLFVFSVFPNIIKNVSLILNLYKHKNSYLSTLLSIYINTHKQHYIKNK